MIIVGRPINGITINPLEFILNKNKEIHKFRSKRTAIKFLKKAGYTAEDMEGLTF